MRGLFPARRETEGSKCPCGSDPFLSNFNSKSSICHWGTFLGQPVMGTNTLMVWPWPIQTTPASIHTAYYHTLELLSSFLQPDLVFAVPSPYNSLVWLLAWLTHSHPSDLNSTFSLKTPFLTILSKAYSSSFNFLSQDADYFLNNTYYNL